MATRALKPANVESVGEVLDKMDADPVARLAKLRDPFPPNQISKLPKPLAKREVMDTIPKAKCRECGGYHATDKIIHLDYVGHAALTDRLLDTDPQWSWEPVGFTSEGLPALDRNGGLWIKLTVCGVTRFGYGCADGKSGGDAMKEIIGDALRNAAMRFGAALDLWHKGELHADSNDDDRPTPRADPTGVFITQKQRDDIVALATEAKVSQKAICGRYGIDDLSQLHADTYSKCVKQLQATIESRKQPADILDDSIPY